MQTHKLRWQETRNDVTIDCSLDVRVHPAKSKIMLLLVPGVDGSVDGYKNKYVTIAESIQKKHGIAVVRMGNPYITSFHWESNIRHILQFIEDNKQEICSNDNYEIRIQAHSAGASVVASLAHGYRQISRLLLINIAMSLGQENIIEGIKKFDGDITILMGDKEPSYDEALKLSSNKNINIVTVKNADHNFSGDAFSDFLEAADRFLF